MAEPLIEAEQVSEIAFGFMASKALFVALHLDLFTHIAAHTDTGAHATAEALASTSGVSIERVTTIMTALVASGLIQGGPDEYRNSPAAESFLVRGARNDFGDYLRYQIDRQMFPFMNQLEAVVTDSLTEDHTDSYAKWMADPDEARLYTESQHAGSLGPGRTLARLVDLSNAEKLLDVAGGSGGLATRLCEAYPALNVTILDFPNVVQLATEKTAHLADRIDVLGGDALVAKWPGPVDAVLMSYLWSGVPGFAISDLAAKAFDVLTPGGQIIVHDFMVDDDRQGPRLAALWQLQHLAFTPEAISLTPGAVKGCLAAAGFVDLREDVLIPGMTRVVFGRTPDAY